MRVQVTAELDLGSRKKMRVISVIDRDMEQYFMERDYNGNIDAYSFILRILEPVEQLPDLLKEKKPLFRKKAKMHLADGSSIECSMLMNPIVITGESYERFVLCDDKTCCEIISDYLLSRVDNVKLPKSVGDFDNKKFLDDLKSFSENYL